MGMNPLVVFVPIVALVVVIGVFAWQMEKKRREAIAAWARANGWSHHPGKRGSPGYPFSLFETGHSRWSRDHMRKTLTEATPGLDAAEAGLFEHHYAQTSGSGKDRRTTHYHFTCAVVEPGLDLGAVTIRPEGWGDKIVQAIGFDDIDFEDHEFSRKFVVKAKDRRAAYELCDPRMMEFLLGHRGVKLETAGRLMLVSESGSPKPERLDRLARFVEGFLATLPRTMVNAERGNRGLPPIVDAGSAARHHRTGP